jgi:hypothetical protein
LRGTREFGEQTHLDLVDTDDLAFLVCSELATRDQVDEEHENVRNDESPVSKGEKIGSV